MSHVSLTQLWFNSVSKIPSSLKREGVSTGTVSWWPLSHKQRWIDWHTKPQKDPNYSALRQTKDCLDRGVCKAVTIADHNYPPLLRSLPDAPLILFYRGNLELLSLPSLAVVGGRMCTASARALCRRWVPQLAERGLCIVSGLARGVDAEAHLAALSYGANTVAVLAGGLGRLYPKEHRELFERIAESGCVVSEQLWPVSAKRFDFPKRNRIVSGLCAVTLIVEASLKSGSLITARHALSQGREVAAIPNSPLVHDLQGPNELIKQGACLVTNPQDVIDLYDGLPLINNDLQLVLNSIGSGCVAIEDISAVTELDESAIWSALASLEIDDLVIQKNGLWSRLTAG